MMKRFFIEPVIVHKTVFYHCTITDITTKIRLDTSMIYIGINKTLFFLSFIQLVEKINFLIIVLLR